MKELTIEEKAQRYDDAIDVCRKLYNKAKANGYTALSEAYEQIFPELKVSEDEKIRKWLIALIKSNEYGPISNVGEMPCPKLNVLAWLEKQNSNVDNANKEYWRGYREGKQEILDKYAELEKQGEQSKEATYTHEVATGNGNIKALVTEKVQLPKFKIGDTIVEKDFDECGYGTIKDIKDGQYIFTDGSAMNINEQGGWQLVKSSTNIEQNPADKVEPKFKKKEWLVENHPNNYARFLQILEIYNFNGKNNYVVSRDLHNDEDVAECEFIETHWHPFYVKDAKDCDVLRIRNLTFIFQEITNNNACHKDAVVAYCSYEDNDDAFGVCGPDCITDLEIITPATKEQRDLLFAKMKEAGYEWDANKKELKKIKQKTTDSIPEDFEKYVEQLLSLSDGEGHGSPAKVKEVSLKLLKLAKIEQKTAEWSEEDEKEVAVLEAYIRSKDWSESHIDRALGIVDELVNKVKSLRPQKWRPTEDQIMCLQDAISGYQHRGYKAETLESLCKQLKQLRIMSSYTTGNKVCNHCKGSGKKFLIFKCPYCNGKGSIYGTFKDD